MSLYVPCRWYKANNAMQLHRSRFSWMSRKMFEEKFEIKKWQKIADGIEARCGQKYPDTAIQKKYKQLRKRVKTSGPVVNDE